MKRTDFSKYSFAKSLTVLFKSVIYFPYKNLYEILWCILVLITLAQIPALNDESGLFGIASKRERKSLIVLQIPVEADFLPFPFVPWETEYPAEIYLTVYYLHHVRPALATHQRVFHALWNEQMVLD